MYKCFDASSAYRKYRLQTCKTKIVLNCYLKFVAGSYANVQVITEPHDRRFVRVWTRESSRDQNGSRMKSRHQTVNNELRTMDRYEPTRLDT